MRRRESGISGRILSIGGGSPIGVAKAIALATLLPIVAIPTTYSEVWGDYFGVWRGSRERQSILGLLPTLLAVVGWAVLLARSRKVPARLPAALLPGLGILGYLYFTVSYPTPDGDVLKASYMLTTAPAWALAFGYAIDRLPGRTRLVVAAILAASALASLPFLLY